MNTFSVSINNDITRRLANEASRTIWDFIMLMIPKLGNMLFHVSSYVQGSESTSVPRGLSNGPEYFMSNVRDGNFYFKRAATGEVVCNVPNGAIISISKDSFRDRCGTIPFTNDVHLMNGLPLILTFCGRSAIQIYNERHFFSFKQFIIILILGFFLTRLYALLICFFTRSFVMSFHYLISLLLLRFLLIYAYLGVYAISGSCAKICRAIIWNLVWGVIRGLGTRFD